MKNGKSLLSVVAVCVLAFATSCVHEVTPDTLSGTYHGTMDVEINLPALPADDWELPNYQATVVKVDASHVDIVIDLNLSKYINAAFAGQDLDYGNITARCLVAPTVDGEAVLSGSAQVAGQSVPVYGEYDDRVLDVSIALGLVSVEFEGVRR